MLTGYASGTQKTVRLPLSEESENTETVARFRRSTRVKRPLMKNSFIGRFLDKSFTADRALKTNTEICKYLREMSLLDLEGEQITESTPEGDDHIARTMATECIAAIHRADHANAQHWYSDSIKKAINIFALLQPEIASDAAALSHPKSKFKSTDDAKTVLFVAMAVTSQNIPVRDNMRYALEQYRYFLKHGKFNPKSYGTKGASVKNNLNRFNQLMDIFNGDIAMIRRFLNTEFTMAEVTKAAAKVGMTISGREMVDEPVYGSIIFGPKVGNGFYQNLSGNFSPITIDLWFQRSWGRWTGTLMKDSVSAEQIQRFVAGVVKDHLLTAALKRNGDWIEPPDLPDLENDEILDYARKVHRIWEQSRKSLLGQGSDNAHVSRRKAELDWPNASEAIIKALGQPVDAPTSKGQRRWIRNVANRAIRILKVNGFDLEIAELQALLWVPEKALYSLLSGRKVKVNTVSYDQAITKLALKEGITDAAIQSAIYTVDQDRNRRQRDSEAAGECEQRAVRGDGPGTHENFGAAFTAQERKEFVNPPLPAAPPVEPEPELAAAEDFAAAPSPGFG